MSLRQASVPFALLVLACGAACSGGAEPGLRFDPAVVDLGRVEAGDPIELRFPFVVAGRPVTVTELAPSCGCLAPRLVVDGRPLELPARLEPGTRGEVRTTFRTAGFSGRKDTGVTVRGEGPGLPTELVVRSEIVPWFRAEPRFVDFGVVDGSAELRTRVRVSGRAPFRFVEAVPGTPFLHVEGVPSATPAAVQEVELVLPPTTDEGRHTAFVGLTDEAGRTALVPVRWEVAGPLWTRPDGKVLLGEFPAARGADAVVEVGAREGELFLVEARLEGIPGASATVHAVQPGRLHRVDLRLPPGLASGVVSGDLSLVLHRRMDDGSEARDERELRVLGIARGEDDTP